MRFNKWLALLLSLCLLFAVMATALGEDEQPQAEDAAEVVAEDAESASAEIEGTLDAVEIVETEATGEEGGEETQAPVEEPTETAAPTGPVPSAPHDTKLRYARVTKGEAPVYFESDDDEVIAKLASGEAVLITGSSDGRTAIAINASGRIYEGFMKPSTVSAMSEKEAADYVAKIISGKVALYDNDLNWPLGPLSSKSDTKALAVLGTNYTDASNQKAYAMNGKMIYADMVATKGKGNCWSWARDIYSKVWGVKFDSTFEGRASTGLNLLRNLTDDERLLTPDNLKLFVRNSKPGATLRIGSCVSTCGNFNTDGCGQHNKHSLIIAEIRDDGLVTMDDQGTVHTRFYTWQGFCNSWAKRYTHVKYIKWPNAPALPSTENLDGYAVSVCSETYRVRATAGKAATVCTLPSGGEVLATLTYPAKFTATRMSVKTIDNYTWVYGKSSSGITGWLALSESVANVNATISVTGVSLSQTSLVLLKGGTATLKAIVEPADASNLEVTWSSSDAEVATVSNGVVTGVAGGTATITVATADGGKKATCQVKVVQADGSKTLSKTGSNGTVKLILGQQLQLVPKFATSKGWKIKSVKSSKSSVASVSKEGIVSAKKVGTATIAVATKNGKKATLTVKVVDPNAPTGVVLNRSGTVKLKVGGTLKLYTKLKPDTASSALTWKSSKPEVAYVDGEGNVIALKKGTCTIGVMTENKKYDTVKIKVK